MSNVVHLSVVGFDHTTVEGIIETAKAAKLKEIIILGYDEDGLEHIEYAGQNEPTLNWLLDRAKLKLQEAYDEE